MNSNVNTEEKYMARYLDIEWMYDECGTYVFSVICMILYLTLKSGLCACLGL